MTTFEIPPVTTERLQLRVFQAGDLDAYAAMQANPEVMRFLVDGTHTRRSLEDHGWFSGVGCCVATGCGPA